MREMNDCKRCENAQLDDSRTFQPVCQAKGQRAQANGEWANANWRMVAKGSNVDHFLRKWARMAANAAIHMHQCRISLMYFVEMHPV